MLNAVWTLIKLLPTLIRIIQLILDALKAEKIQAPVQAPVAPVRNPVDDRLEELERLLKERIEEERSL